MRLDKVDLNLFVVFDAIYRERSVTKVAALLNLSQPAVSNALSRLRQTFDDPLFVRTPQGMTPTPVSDGVITDVRKALQLLGRSVGSNARFDARTSEKAFRLGMNDLVEALVLPQLQKKMASLAPRASINSYYIDRLQAAEDLKSERLDLLLDSPAVNAKEFEQRSLCQLDYVVAIGPNHPMAGLPVTFEQYLKSDHLHVSSRRKGRGQMDIALHATGYKRRIMMRVQNYLVAQRIIEQTCLMWTVPKVLVENTSLFFSPMPFEVEPLAWNLYWHKSNHDDPASLWMRDIIAGIVDNITSIKA